MSEPTPIADKLLLRPAEAGALLSVSVAEAYRLIQAGELRSVRLGGRLRVPRSAVEAFVANLERQQRIAEDHARSLLGRRRGA